LEKYKIEPAIANFLFTKKISTDIRRRIYQAIVVNCCQYNTLGKRKLSSERREQEEIGNDSPQLSPQDMRVDDVGYSGETDHELKD
jgi:hypothetical protein